MAQDVMSLLEQVPGSSETTQEAMQMLIPGSG